MRATEIKRALLGAAVFVVGAVSVSQAQAQEETSPAVGSSANPQDTSAIDIVVTATKRDTTLINTPAAVSAFNEKAIAAAGITRPTDFLKMVPNVTFFEDNAQEAQVAVRGQAAARGADQNVGFIIDGVQLTSNKLFNNNLFAVQQIEVLKGPQTALYGRNAAAGVVVITSKAPTDTFGGEVQVGYGNWHSARADFTVSGPLSSGFKFRLSGQIADTDGPYKSLTTGEDVRRQRDIAGRLHLRYDDGGPLTVDLRAGASHSRGGGVAYNAQFAGLPIGGVPVPRLDANQTNIPFVSNIIGRSFKKIYDSSLTANYDLGFATFTSISAYTYLDVLAYAGDLIPYIADTPSAPGAPGTQKSYTKDKAFSQELRLTSRGDQSLRWMIGAYYLNLDRRQTTILGGDVQGLVLPGRGIELPGSLNPTVAIADSKFKTKDYAVFANAQYDILDNLELSIAGRYDIEKKSVQELAPDAINPVTGANYNLCVLALSIPLDQCNDSATFRKFVPKATLTYKSDIGTLYASYGKGFKSGGYNPIGTRAATIAAVVAAGGSASDVYVQDAFPEETSESYEVGAKGRFFDGLLNVNLAAYLTDISNAQQFVFFPTAGIQAIESIDKIRVKGFEVDATLNLPGDIQLSAAYGYNHGRIRKYTPNPAFEGNVAPLALKYTVNVAASKVFHVTDSLTLTPRAEYQRLGPIFWDAANTAGTERSAVNLVNARVTLSGERWEAGLWGKNIFQERYNAEFVPLIGVLAVVYKADPRSYGVDFKVKF